MKILPPTCAQAAVALVAMAIGWGWAGRWAGPARPGAADRLAGPSKPERILAIGKGQLDAEIAAVTAAGDVDAQIAAAVALAGRIDPKDFALFLDNLRHLPAHAAQGLASRTILRRWVALDPAAALAWCAAYDRRMVNGVLDEWVHQTPPENIADLLDRIPAPHHAEAIASVFNGLVAHDPKAAIDLLTRPIAPGSMSRIDGALKQLACQDPAWLLERADRLPDSIRPSLREAAAQAMVESGAPDAISWVLEQPDRQFLLGDLATNPGNLPAVIAAMASLPHEEQNQLPVRSNYLGSSGSSATIEAFVDAIASHRENLSPPMLRLLISESEFALARTADPGALANRMLALGVEDGLNVSDFAKLWARHSPDAARTWAASLSNESIRHEAIQAIDSAAHPPEIAPPPPLVTQLAEQGSPFEPQRFLALTEDERRQVLQVGFDHIAQNPSNENDDHTWSTLAHRYPAEAARLLADTLTAENTAALMRPLTATASAWAAEDPQAAARWAATLPPGDPRTWAVANVAAQWRLIDEPAARAWVQSLPPTNQ